VVQLLLFTHPKGASGTISEDLFSLGDQFFGFTRQYAKKTMHCRPVAKHE